MVLALVVGPSGAGKDTLINEARRRLADDPNFAFVRRVVTRPAVATLEDHDSIDETSFSSGLRRGDFALYWEAHGLRYGIPASVDFDLEEGRVVVANGSRKAIGAARAKYPDSVVFLISADRDVRAARLAHRGRENAAEVSARLERQAVGVPADVKPMVIDNSGDLDDSVAAFIAMLRRLAARQQHQTGPRRREHSEP